MAYAGEVGVFGLKRLYVSGSNDTYTVWQLVSADIFFYRQGGVCVVFGEFPARD